jgi:RNA polymerase sigma-70 factor, ECF subfamily
MGRVLPQRGGTPILTMPDPDAELLQRTYAGDEDAFVDLYERHRRPLFRFVYRMLGSAAVAEDLTHECFLVLLTQRDRFDPTRGPLRPFLWGVARNLALKQLRRRGVEVVEVSEEGDLEEQETPGPLGRLLENERCAAVQEAVASLPPLQREVLILFEYEGQSLAEIAALVVADTGTVKARLHRARERLRRALAPWLSAVPGRPRSLEKMA